MFDRKTRLGIAADNRGELSQLIMITPRRFWQLYDLPAGTEFTRWTFKGYF